MQNPKLTMNNTKLLSISFCIVNLTLLIVHFAIFSYMA